MTWKEVKAEIDRQLKKQGISEDTIIRFIDITYPETILDFKVFLDDELLDILNG